jgi:hypothetical protein
MSEVEIIPTTEEHLDMMEEQAREIDRTEVWYQTGMPFRYGLDISHQLSTHCWSGFYNGDLVTVGGVCLADIADKTGQPWLVGTDKVDRAAIPFLRHSWYYLNKYMKDGYDYLYNHVYDDNVSAKRWLTWLGFEMSEPRPHGPFGQAFRKFEWRR